MLSSARRPLLAVLVLVALLGSLRAHAFVSDKTSGTEETFSPLFARRLEVGILSLDNHPDQVLTASLSPPNRRTEPDDRPPQTPASGGPFSLCIASACLGSLCLGSACLSSQCLGSACVNSACLGSGCAVSACGGSACLASTCVGSVCTGSACAGSACLGCYAETPIRERG